jgi:two-component system chemotaxis response regulator CheB
VVVQDEATSTVWGMPGAVAQAGLAHQIVPISQVASTVERLISPARVPVTRALTAGVRP